MTTARVAVDGAIIQLIEPDWSWLDSRPVTTEEEQLTAALRYITRYYGSRI